MRALGLFDPTTNTVTVNMAFHRSPLEAVSTVIHEAAHQEYAAFRNEFIFNNDGALPSPGQELKIFNQVKSLYPDLPEGTNPFGGN
jgi:hypothetical protein